MHRKNFIVKNETFTCKHCGKTVKEHPNSCRNHCPHCLRSLHVDKSVPGDRQSTCKGVMMPIALDQSGKKGYIIKHQCTKCGKIQANKAAPDDNFDQLIALSTHETHPPPNSR